MRLIWLSLLVVAMVNSSAHAGLNFQFDYSYDKFGFFDDPARRDALEAAGRVLSRYTDDLSAVIPSGENSWTAFFTPPSGGGSSFLSDVPIPAGTMMIYVAGMDLPGRLAQSIELGAVGFGDPDWVETVKYRGQLGGADDPATDYGSLGGTISFNSNADDVRWHFDLTTVGLESQEFDFITVAAHELLHLMGFGVAHSFGDHVNAQGEFIGSESVAVGSPTNPDLKVDSSEAHWRSNTEGIWNGRVQEALMAPGIFPGARALLTGLDRAAMRDIGWEEATAGDANRDGLFNTADLVAVFQAGLYETGEFAAWPDGDWDDNLRFDSSDLVAALQTGTYEQPVAARIIPEPGSLALTALAMLLAAPALRRPSTARSPR